MTESKLSTDRVVPIRELAERDEREAAQRLGTAREALARREAQLAELENYCEPPARAAASVEMLRNREAFRLRLSEAILQQRRAVEEARHQLEQTRGEWLRTRQDLQITQKLYEQCEQRERRREERRQQREMDEFATRLGRCGLVSGDAA